MSGSAGSVLTAELDGGGNRQYEQTPPHGRTLSLRELGRGELEGGDTVALIDTSTALGRAAPLERQRLTRKRRRRRVGSAYGGVVVPVGSVVVLSVEVAVVVDSAVVGGESWPAGVVCCVDVGWVSLRPVVVVVDRDVEVGVEELVDRERDSEVFGCC